MPEIQEQIQDYRWPSGTELLVLPLPRSSTRCPGLVALSPACVRRTKRTMGLGSLYGENDLLDLDGDPQKERQVAEKQLAQLGDIL